MYSFAFIIKEYYQWNILGWLLLFSFSHLKIVAHCLMAFNDSVKQSVIIQVIVALYEVWISFSSCSQNVFFISYYHQFIHDATRFFVVITINWASFMPFIKYKKLSAPVSSDMASVPFSLSSLPGTLFTCKLELKRVLPAPNILFIRVFFFQFSFLCSLCCTLFYSFKFTEFLASPSFS